MSSNSQTLANVEETSNSTPIFRATARRTPSFSSCSSGSSHNGSSSSSSSSFYFNEDYPTFSPTTPLKFKGIPFSWEQIPGIPKHSQLGSTKKEYSEHLLPLPPAGNSNSAAKKLLLHQEEISPKKGNRFQRDPFFAALVECSKDDHYGDDHIANKNVTRSLSGRFGFINLYTSCKRNCSVSEPIVYLRPRPSPSPQYLLNRRSS